MSGAAGHNRRRRQQRLEPFSLTIETASGARFDVEVTGKNTILDLKYKIYDIERMPVARQRLLYLDEELPNFSTIGDSDIPDGAIIKLLENEDVDIVDPVEEDYELLDFEAMNISPERYHIRDLIPPCTKVIVFIFFDGNRFDVLKTLQHPDGSYSPLPVTSNGFALRPLTIEIYPEEPENGDDDYPISVRKMIELREKIRALQNPNNEAGAGPSGAQPPQEPRPARAEVEDANCDPSDPRRIKILTYVSNDPDYPQRSTSGSYSMAARYRHVQNVPRIQIPGLNEARSRARNVVRLDQDANRQNRPEGQEEGNCGGGMPRNNFDDNAGGGAGAGAGAGAGTFSGIGGGRASGSGAGTSGGRAAGYGDRSRGINGGTNGERRAAASPPNTDERRGSHSETSNSNKATYVISNDIINVYLPPKAKIILPADLLKKKMIPPNCRTEPVYQGRVPDSSMGDDDDDDDDDGLSSFPFAPKKTLYDKVSEWRPFQDLFDSDSDDDDEDYFKIGKWEWDLFPRPRRVPRTVRFNSIRYVALPESENEDPRSRLRQNQRDRNADPQSARGADQPTGFINIPPGAASASSSPSTSAPVEKTVIRKRTKCIMCDRNLHITTTYNCRCGGPLCSDHHPPQNHGCPFGCDPKVHQKSQKE